MSLREVIRSLETRDIPFRINAKHDSITIGTGEELNIVVSEQSEYVTVTFESDNFFDRLTVVDIEEYLTNNFLCSKCRTPLVHTDDEEKVLGNCPNDCTTDMRVN